MTASTSPLTTYTASAWAGSHLGVRPHRQSIPGLRGRRNRRKRRRAATLGKTEIEYALERMDEIAAVNERITRGWELYDQHAAGPAQHYPVHDQQGGQPCLHVALLSPWSN